MTCIRVYAKQPYTIPDVISKLAYPDYLADIDIPKDYEVEVYDLGMLMARFRRTRRGKNGEVLVVEETEYTTRAEITLTWRRDGDKWRGMLCIEPYQNSCVCECSCDE